jgi:hypothetical protein
MVDPTESLYKNITLTDVQLASAYYPILIDLAKKKQRITYGELVAKAKRMYPTTSTGRRLDVIRIFTAERELPDITSLVINKDTGECGVDFTKYFDPVATRKKYMLSIGVMFLLFSIFPSNTLRPSKLLNSESRNLRLGKRWQHFTNRTRSDYPHQ